MKTTTEGKWAFKVLAGNFISEEDLEGLGISADWHLYLSPTEPPSAAECNQLMNSYDLSACPCCGGRATIIGTLKTCEWSAICTMCGLETAHMMQPKDAALAWNKRHAPDEEGAALRAQPAGGGGEGYSLDADPRGIRAATADAITGALAFGAQGNNPPPAGHWLLPFWKAARADASGWLAVLDLLRTDSNGKKWNCIASRAGSWVDVSPYFEPQPVASPDGADAFAYGASALTQPQPEKAMNEHTDDSAIDRFAAAMKSKMAKQRDKGYGDWDNPAACPAERLVQCLRESVLKGDPVDVGNFAMMLFNRGQKGDAVAPYNVRSTPNPPTALDLERAAGAVSSVSSLVPTTPENEEEPDSECKEADDCPTEGAVLKRFWREHQPDPKLCEFYQVKTLTELVAAQEEHVLKLQDTVRRNVKPWEDTMPPTLLPKYLRDTGLDAAEPKVQTVVVYGATPPESGGQGDYAAMIARHQIRADECPGQSMVVLASSMRKLLATHPPAQTSGAVTEAMVLAACRAHDPMYESCGSDTRADMRADIRRALEAALAQGGGNER